MHAGLPEQFRRLGVRLGESVSQSGIGDLEEHTLANESWSLELLFAEILAQGVPLALTNDQNQFGVVFWAL